MTSALSISDDEYVEQLTNLGSCVCITTSISLSVSTDEDKVLKWTCLSGFGFEGAETTSSDSVLLDESDGGVCGIIIPRGLHFGLLLCGEHVAGTKQTVVLS